MSIFQPSNIIPSSFSGLGNGVVDVNDDISVSWQVNGTSPLMGYTVYIYENNADSTFVDSFGERLSTPFYGVDSKGNPQIFTTTNETWASYGMTNGKSYKIVIIQYWGTYQNGEWSNSVTQISPSAFITRTNPTVELTNFSSSISASSASFSASYTQAEGDSINWSRWVLQRVDSNGVATTVDDTGEIATANLSYSYDGFVSEYNYQISLTVETENGVQATTGFVDFSVSYTIDEDYQLPVQAVSDSSMLLRFFDLDGSASPSSGYGNFVGDSLSLAQSSSVTWNSRQGESLSIPTTPAYQVAWKGNATPFSKSYTDTNTNNQVVAAVSVGNILFVGGKSIRGSVSFPTLLIYRETSVGINLIESIDVSQIDPLLSSQVNDLKASPNGSTLIVGGVGGMSVFEVQGETASFVQHLTPFLGRAITPASTVEGLAFLDDETFVAVGSFGVYDFKYSNGSWHRQSVISEETTASKIAVSPSAEYFAVGYKRMRGKLFSVFPRGGGDERTPIPPFGSSEYYRCNSIQFFNDNTIAFGGSHFVSAVFPRYIPLNSIYNVTSSSVVKDSDIPTPTGGSASSINSFAYYQPYGLFVASDYNGNGAVYSGVQSPSYLYKLSFEYPANVVLFSEDGTRFYSVGEGFISAYNFSQSCDFLGIYSNSFPDAADNIFFSRNLSTIGISGRLGALSASFTIAGEYAVLLLSESQIEAWFFQNGEQVDYQSAQISYSQSEINSIVLNGESTTEYVWVFDASDSDFDPSSKPSIDGETYFLTNFSQNSIVANGYPIASNSLSGMLFSSNNSEMKRLVTLSTNITNIKDFSAKSGESMEYVLLYSTANQNIYYSSASICARWNAYYLIEAQQDATDPTVFHALNVWKFGNNISQNAISNNNSPAWQTNFTPYRFRQPSSRMGKSGTLTALLSNVKDQRYSDSAALMETLFSASQSQNVFFLKDMKGNLFMVQISGPITQTINTKSCVQQVTVSIPWEEVGDASEVSLIQTSVDNGFTIGDSSQNI